jgi:tetratricopeptide (TPR) repeat protein
MAAGSYGAAQERLSAAGDQNPHVLRLRLELAARRGDEEGVRRHAGRLLGLYDSGALRSPGEIAEAAYAAWQFEQWKRANQLYLEAARGDGAPLWLYVDWGNLYLEKHNGPEAEAIFRDGLKAPAQEGWSRWGKDDARLGVVRALKAQQMTGVDEALAQVLKENAENLDAHVLKGLLAMEAGNWKEAEEWIGRGLDGNPNYVPLLELECVQLHFQEKKERFRERLQKLLEINPRNGNLYRIMGDFSVVRRRMEEAIEYYREAVRRNPGEWSALASLGVNLLRLAQEEEGKQVLERAYENDPYNISTVNTLRLVDSFDRFVRNETPRYWLRLHRKEAGALEPYVRRLLDRSISVLEEKYRHRVDHKFLVEFYPDHEDFAVRALGLPGLGAFGATFGRILAMDSPSARPKGTYHWGSTLWHEMAHVVILSLSRDRVPRWLTEGISMMEERLAGSGWGDGLTPSLVRAYERGEIAPLKDLNKGFESPRTREHLQISYLQAGLACRFLADRYGIEKVRDLVVGLQEAQP